MSTTAPTPARQSPGQPCQFAWPGWVKSSQVEDEALGQAYEQVGPKRRAWMKTLIARLYDFHGPARVAAETSVSRFRQGFTVSLTLAPLDFTLLLLSERSVSAPRMLALLMPALCARVGEVAVARLACGERDGGRATPWPAELLAGLELAGVETIWDFDRNGLDRLALEAAQSGSGLVLDLDDALSGVSRLGPLEVYHPRWQGRVGVAREAGLDLEAIAWAHPDAHIEHFDVDGPWPDVDVAFVPEHALDQAMGRVPLALGPGAETSFLWPGLSGAHFASRRATLSGAGPGRPPEGPA